VHVQISDDGISASGRSNVLPTLADDGCHSIIELYFFIRTQNWHSILLVMPKKLRHAALDSAHISDGRFRPSQRAIVQNLKTLALRTKNPFERGNGLVLTCTQ
jgi:hypothetical protein